MSQWRGLTVLLLLRVTSSLAIGWLFVSMRIFLLIPLVMLNYGSIAVNLHWRLWVVQLLHWQSLLWFHKSSLWWLLRSSSGLLKAHFVYVMNLKLLRLTDWSQFFCSKCAIGGAFSQLILQVTDLVLKTSQIILHILKIARSLHYLSLLKVPNAICMVHVLLSSDLHLFRLQSWKTLAICQGFLRSFSILSCAILRLSAWLKANRIASSFDIRHIVALMVSIR